jgi:L-cysteate sulfo-lyase
MAMNLSQFPRISLAHLPTPLEPMDRLSEALGGPRIFVKRDDCTGLASGGNKTRKLEFLMADALGQGADTVITQGAVQSNHVRQTLAAAARLKMHCKVLLETRVPDAPDTYNSSGNVLLDRIFAADIGYREAGSDMDAAMDEVAESVIESGGRPYIIPGGGSNRVGALGYVDCAHELTGQLGNLGLSVSRLIVASGSAGTQAGLVAGLSALNSTIETTGISVRADEKTQVAKVHGLTTETAKYIGVKDGVPESKVVVRDQFVGGGYGIPTEGMLEAVQMCAQLEGILLDPVYSGKAMAGLIGMVRAGELSVGDNVVFVHTGGSAALFAYDWFFNEHIRKITSAQ